MNSIIWYLEENLCPLKQKYLHSQMGKISIRIKILCTYMYLILCLFALFDTNTYKI